MIVIFMVLMYMYIMMAWSGHGRYRVPRCNSPIESASRRVGVCGGGGRGRI